MGHSQAVGGINKGHGDARGQSLACMSSGGGWRRRRARRANFDVGCEEHPTQAKDAPSGLGLVRGYIRSRMIGSEVTIDRALRVDQAEGGGSDV